VIEALLRRNDGRAKGKANGIARNHGRRGVIVPQQGHGCDTQPQPHADPQNEQQHLLGEHPHQDHGNGQPQQGTHDAHHTFAHHRALDRMNQ